MDSILGSTHRGHFGYEVIKENQFIPFTYRENEKYCATKVFICHLEKELIDSNQSLSNFDYLNGYGMHTDEVCLWNEINRWHNDSMYPVEFVYGTDTLLRMKDIQDIFKYVDDCKQKKQHGVQTKVASGIARIWWSLTKREIILPYVVQNGHRYVPLYIPSVPKTLAIATTLTGIDVLYMRFLFEALNEQLLIRSNQIPCVLLDEAVTSILRTQMNGSFEYSDDYWPEPKNTTENNNELPFFANNQKNNQVMDEPKSVHVQPDTSVANAKRKQTSVTAKAEGSKRQKKADKKTEKRSNFYEVEYLLDYKIGKKGEEMVFVHWKGYDSKFDTWEPASNLNDALKEDLDTLREKFNKNSTKSKQMN